MSKMNARRQLGWRLHQARKAASITREELAGELGETVFVIKNWELGRTRIPAERLVAIATACRTTVSDLLEQQQPATSATARAA